MTNANGFTSQITTSPRAPCSFPSLIRISISSRPTFPKSYKGRTRGSPGSEGGLGRTSCVQFLQYAGSIDKHGIF